jgi:hypothetical protein
MYINHIKDRSPLAVNDVLTHRYFKYHLEGAEFVTVRVVTTIKRRGWMSR